MTESKPPSLIATTIGAPVWGMAIAAMQAILWLFWMLLLVKGAPALEVVLVETNALLPQASVQFLMMSDTVVNFWYILVLIGPPLMLLEVGVIAASAQSGARWLTVARYGLVTLFTLVPLLLLGWAILGACLAANAAAMTLM